MKNSSIGMTMTTKKPTLLERKFITLPMYGRRTTYLPTMSTSEMMWSSVMALLSPLVV